MAVVKKHANWVEIPHEPGERLQLRSLSHTEDAEAEAETTAHSIELMRALADVPLPVIERPAARTADLLNTHERATVLRFAVVAWTYEGEVDTDGLDPKTADWAAREILKLTHPSEDDLGKGSSRSTATSADPDSPPRNG